MTENIFTAGLYDWIENKSAGKFYPYYLGFFLMVCSLVFAMPDFATFDSQSFAWKTVLLKGSDITNNLIHVDPHNWLSKKVFRLTVPVIMRIMHLSPAGIIILQYVLGYFSLVYCYLLSLRITKDTVSSTLIAAGIVFLYFGRAAFYDLQYTWFDEFAFFSLIIAMYSKNIFLIFLFSFSAAWTDERGFIALFIILLYHQLNEIKVPEINFVKLIKFNNRSVSVLMAIVSYAVLRIFLSLHYNMHTNSTGANLSLLKTTAPYLLIGAWTFIEGFWLIYLYVLGHSIRNKNYLFSMVILAILIIFTIVSGSVTDVTRSGSYMAPVIFILINYAFNYLRKNEMRKILFRSAVISFIFPALIVCPEWGWGDGLSSVFKPLLRSVWIF